MVHYRIAMTALLSSCLIAGIATTLPAYAETTSEGPTLSQFQMAALEHRPSGQAILSGDYQRAIDALSDNSAGRFESSTNLCVAYTLKGDLDLADGACGTALDLSRADSQGKPTSGRRNLAIALSNRGVLRAVRGDVEGAHDDFRRATDAKVDLPQAKANLRTLLDS